MATFHIDPDASGGAVLPPQRAATEGAHECAPSRLRSWRRWVVGSIHLGFLAAMLVMAAPAAAHARLLSSAPAQGEVLKALPSAIELRFTEEIGQPAAIVVEAPDGGPTSVGRTEVSSRSASVRLANREAMEGTYVASYQVTSRDGHTISGTVSFEVTSSPPGQGSPSSASPAASPTGVRTELLSSSVPRADAEIPVLPEVAVLNFAEPVRKPAKLSLRGPGGAELSTGAPDVVDATLFRPLAYEGEVTGGRYTLDYAVTTASGEPVTGSLTFVVSGAAGSDASTVAAQDGLVRAQPPPTDGGTVTGLRLGLVLGLALGLLTAALLVVVSLRSMVSRATQA